MPLFRCTNDACSEEHIDRLAPFDFESDHPVCPKCKRSGKIIPLATIHYLVSLDSGPIRTPNGNRQIACQPLLSKLPKHATGETAATNCPQCRASSIFKEHVEANIDQQQEIMDFRPV